MPPLKALTIILILFFSQTIFSQVSQDANVSESVFINNAHYKNLPVNLKTNSPFRYFYYPNLQAYFDNLNQVYYYKMNGEWQINDELPPNYGGYSLFNYHKVIIDDYVDDKPYELIQVHKAKYPYNARGRFNKEG